MIAGEIPDYFRIYMASHNLEISTSYIRHSECIMFDLSGAKPPLLDVPNNIQTITFMLGRVFIHLNAARIENFDLESRVDVTFKSKLAAGSFWDAACIWPGSASATIWPRRPLVDSEGIRVISEVLVSYSSASKVTWLPIAP